MAARQGRPGAKRPRIQPTFFSTSSHWRDWLENHHAHRSELWVGFHKKDSGKASLSWPESVDKALCFGWIDGLRRSIDETSYMIRFTPRKPRSIWSAVNVKRMKELTRQGRVSSAGVRAFEKRDGERTEIYAYEQRTGAELSGIHRRQFRANQGAWDFFCAQPPWYRRTASWWVISAKREDTRAKRLSQLIADSARGDRIAPLRRTKAK